MSAGASSSVVDGSGFRLPLQTEHFFLALLTPDDFDALYAVANDPLLWEQHPETDRWKRVKFERFFYDGLANDLGCFVIREKHSGRPVGSSRFYGYDAANRCIRIGYTFIAREFWGTSANREIKEVMLSRSFASVEQVFFDIGPQNYRSIAAVKKLGAVFSHYESDNKAVYVLSRKQWVNNPE